MGKASRSKREAREARETPVESVSGSGAPVKPSKAVDVDGEEMRATALDFMDQVDAMFRAHVPVVAWRPSAVEGAIELMFHHGGDVKVVGVPLEVWHGLDGAGVYGVVKRFSWVRALSGYPREQREAKEREFKALEAQWGEYVRENPVGNPENH